jgi:serine/threonine protein kinase
LEFSRKIQTPGSWNFSIIYHMGVQPAKRLLGLKLEGEWEVVKELPLPPTATGGFFSTGYLVRRSDGREGFLKALDYSDTFELDPKEIAIELQRITESINFERNLLKTCGDHGLDRIVRAISTGTIRLPDATAAEVVEYLIFELAIADARRQMDSVRSIELAWIFRTLHHIATGLQQLHGLNIAHQDVKPSNVLVFEEDQGRKLADLGRAWCAGHNPPHNGYIVAGDRTYAPPELLYGFLPSDERSRRFGCDLYHLGSMVVYFFTRFGMTSLLIAELHPDFTPGAWTGTYQQLLPSLQDAFGKVLVRLRGMIDPRFQSEVTEVVKELCSPDPDFRGHPKNRSRIGNQYSLERYVAQFDRLAFDAAYRHRL